MWEYLHGLRVLFESNPDITFNWIVHDNSRNKQFNKAIKKEAEQIKKTHKNIDKLVYYINNKNFADTDALERGDVGNIMIEIYNTAFGLVDWKSDYGMIIEDDVLVTQTNALKLLLEAMDEKTGTVTASSFARHVLAHSKTQQAITQHWEFRRHNGKMLATQIKPKDSGVSEVEMSAQSFWLARFDLIKRLGFAQHEKIKGADRSWCLRTKDEGYKTKVVWDIKARHYYKTDDGRMDFINHNKAKAILPREFVLKQLDRKSSPLFVRVPKDMTDVEIEDKYNYKVLKIIV